MRIDDTLRRRLFGAENEAMLGELAARELFDPRQRMIGMDDRHHALPQADLAVKAVVARHVRQYTDIDALIDHGIDDRGPVAHFNGDLNVWIKPMERGDQRHAGHGVAEPDAQFAAFEGVILTKHRQGVRLEPVQLRGDGNELSAQRGGQELVTAPLEERDAEVIFQAADLLGDGGLR
jgi:hypothetical protein